MVSNYNIVVLYAVGIAEVLLPLITLFIIYRYKKYSLSSIVAGFACYFLITNFLVNGVSTFILVAAKDVMFFTRHAVLGILIESALIALSMTPIEYLFLRKTRKGKWMISDAMAMGCAYWLVPLLQNGAVLISEGSIARHANQGRLEELVSEEYTIETLQSLVDSFKEISALEITGQMISVIISQAVILAVAISLALMVYYAAKRGKKSVLLIAMAIDFVYLLVFSGSQKFISYWGSFALVLLIGIAAALFIWRFFRFYRNQQLELLRKRQEFKAEQHAKYQAELEAKQAQKK